VADLRETKRIFTAKNARGAKKKCDTVSFFSCADASAEIDRSESAGE
jgi:hypothetical protein